MQVANEQFSKMCLQNAVCFWASCDYKFRQIDIFLLEALESTGCKNISGKDARPQRKMPLRPGVFARQSWPLFTTIDKSMKIGMRFLSR